MGLKVCKRHAVCCESKKTCLMEVNSCKRRDFVNVMEGQRTESLGRLP
jgi:hypothetical protein